MALVGQAELVRVETLTLVGLGAVLGSQTSEQTLDVAALAFWVVAERALPYREPRQTPEKMAEHMAAAARVAKTRLAVLARRALW
jgi:hypothetical protein